MENPERDLRPTKRRVSEKSEFGLCSDQGPDGTCVFHAIAKILVKNVCGKLFDLEMTAEEKGMYKKCLEKYPIQTEEGIEPYTEAECTEKGFISIMFFYYFYFVTKRNGFRTLKDTIPLLDSMPPRAAAVSPLDSTKFSHITTSMIARKNAKGLTWRSILIKMDSDTYIETITNVIEPVVKLGLYVYMILDGHGIVLIDCVGKQFVLLNSWGYTNDVVPYGLNLRLQGNDTQYTIEMLELLLPMTTEFSDANPTRYIYTNNEFLHVRELYPFIQNYVATQTGGRKRTRRRKSKRYTRFVRLRQ